MFDEKNTKTPECESSVNLKAEDYRDPWLAAGVNKAIGFFPREFYCLDNYSAFKIEYRGWVYATVEEAYQASAFLEVADDVAEQIRHAGSPYEAKQISVANKDRKRPDWETEKLEVMEELLREKVKQHPYVREMLIKTQQNRIVEDSPKDTFWGWGPNRDGENHMGRLWMKLREQVLNGEL
ncbi:MAG: NADAR family protein [Lachnospiraceae bacterium]|nr:NADAR family protein [Lachnospiraceae bacterium]